MAPGASAGAVAAQGPRTVVFRVGGLVNLRSPVVIAEPFLTVAGQTAPGDGICFRGQAVEIRTHNVVVRHLRFRPGDVAGARRSTASPVGGARGVSWSTTARPGGRWTRASRWPATSPT